MKSTVRCAVPVARAKCVWRPKTEDDVQFLHTLSPWEADPTIELLLCGAEKDLENENIPWILKLNSKIV